jgi:hypothetical protein
MIYFSLEVWENPAKAHKMATNTSLNLSWRTLPWLSQDQYSFPYPVPQLLLFAIP